jgi:hypothetical protein
MVQVNRVIIQAVANAADGIWRAERPSGPCDAGTRREKLLSAASARPPMRQDRGIAQFGMGRNYNGLIRRSIPPQDRPKQVLTGHKYCIVRYYRDGAEVIQRLGLLSASDARGIVMGIEHSSLTCKTREGRKHTKLMGAWWDGWRLQTENDRVVARDEKAPKIVLSDRADLATLTEAQVKDAAIVRRMQPRK